MRWRIVELLGVSSVIMIATLAVSVAGQASKTGERTGPSLKTSSGEPDLQGIWRDDYQVPLQRAAQYAGKEFFTDAERDELDKQRAGVVRFGDVGLAKKGTIEDLAGAYNAVFISYKRTGRRTSMIVDPPDGRIPPLHAGSTEGAGRHASLYLRDAPKHRALQKPHTCLFRRDVRTAVTQAK